MTRTTRGLKNIKVRPLVKVKRMLVDRNTGLGWLRDWLDEDEDDWWIGCTGELSSQVKVKRMLVDWNTGLGWLSDWLDEDEWLFGCTGELSSLVKVTRMLVDQNTGLGWLSDWLDEDEWLFGWSGELSGWMIRTLNDWGIDWMRMIDWLAVQESYQAWWRWRGRRCWRGSSLAPSISSSAAMPWVSS